MQLLEVTTHIWVARHQRVEEAMSLPGFKALKDRLTVMLAGNVAG
jgi:hypothetical protein